MSAVAEHEYAYDSWLRVTIDDEEYTGQVHTCDRAGVVVNILGMGQRRVTHGAVVGPTDPPATMPVPEPVQATLGLTTGEVLTLPLAAIEPFARNPREFKRLLTGEVDPDQHGLRELADSLRTLGQQQPVIVRTLPGGGFGLIDGERRFHAATLAGCTTVRAVVQELDDAAALAATVAASNHSEPYSIRDRARAVTWLLAENRTQEEVAGLLKTTQPAVSIYKRVFALPGPVQQAIEEGKLSFGHVRHLVRDHLLLHPKILCKIVELAIARDARVADLAPEIPFENELPAEMVKVLRPQEVLITEEPLEPANAIQQAVQQEQQRLTADLKSRQHTSTEWELDGSVWRCRCQACNAGVAIFPDGVPSVSPKAEARCELAPQTQPLSTPAPPTPVDPKKQPVKTAAEIAEERSRPEPATKPGALKSAEEKIAEQKAASANEPPKPQPVTAVIPAAMADRLAELGGGIIPAVRTWCTLAELADEHEIDVSTEVECLKRFLACCSRMNQAPDTVLEEWEARLPATEEHPDGE